MTTPIKPFSTYPEDRKELLHLAHGVETATDPDDFNSYALRLADLVSGILKDEKYAEEIANKEAEALDVLLTPRHEDEWHEDMHDVIWWPNPINEAPYIGSPLDLGRTVEVHIASSDGEEAISRIQVGKWKGDYYQWWTPLPTNEQVALIQKRIEVATKARSFVTEPVA